MEVAGLVLGIVATWKTCVQVFDVVGQSRNYGTDYELCRVKLEVERVRLLAWGDAMGLSEDRRGRTHPDPRLEVAQNKRLVLRVLGGIQRAFEDAELLRERYGLMEEVQRPESSTASLPGWLRRAGANLRRSARDRQRGGSLGQKTIWVIHDRAQFLEMVHEIRQFNDSLGHLFPDLSLREALRREIGRRREIRPLSLLQEAAAQEEDEEISDLASERLIELGATVTSRSRSFRGNRDGERESDGSFTVVAAQEMHTQPQAAPAAPTAGPATIGEAAAADNSEEVLDALEKRLDAVDVFQSERNRGELSVSLFGPTVYDARTTAYIYWKGHDSKHGLSHFQDRDKGFVKPQHAALELYRKKNYMKRRRKDDYDVDHDDTVLFDIEANPKYENLNPGTVTVEGFALECWEYEDQFGIPRDDTVFVSTSDMSITAERLLRRLDELRRDPGRLGWNREQDRLDLEDFLKSGTVWVDPSRALDRGTEIGDLYRALNRTDIFTEFIAEAAISAHWSGGKNLWNFLWQVVLGKELGRRMEDYPDSWIRGFTARVLATLIISDLWVRNVQIVREPLVPPEAFKKKAESPEEEAQAEAFKEKGNVAMNAKKYQEAVDFYTKALEIGGSNAVYVCNRSSANFCLEKYEEALFDAWIARELDPAYSKAWARLGAALLKTGTLDAAVEAYEAAVRVGGKETASTTKTGLEQAKQKIKEFNSQVQNCKDAKKKHEMVVDLKDKDWNLVINSIKFHSHVHESQVDGLLYFAEKMRWPYLNEVRDVAEEVYSELHGGKTTNFFVADWLYGLTLPGKHFAFKIMTTLVHCSPTISTSLGVPFYMNSNIVLQKQSYWRVCSVLGRVLGALPGIKSLGGWIGPCPPVSISPATESPFKPLHVRLKARHIPPQTPIEKSNDNTIVLDRRRYDPYEYTRPTADEDLNAYIADMMTEEAYVVPQPPVKSFSEVILQSINLKRQPRETNISSNARQQPEDQEAEYRASLTFTIDNSSPITYTLYTNPIFITLPTCYDGPHEVHRRELKRFQTIPWEVERLKEHVPDDDEEGKEGVMLINATGKGAEVLARAWCSERSRHAVVVREGGACLVCAVRCAEMVEVGAVVWVG